VLTSEEGKRVSGDWGYPLTVPVSSQLHVKQVWTGIEVISVREWYWVLLLLQSLDDLGTTLGECLGRTRWGSLLDLTTYLYYFTSGCTPITTRSHVLLEHSTITWPCHVIWLSNLPCYLYLDPIVWLDVRDQICECVGNYFPLGALITTIFPEGENHCSDVSVTSWMTGWVLPKSSIFHILTVPSLLPTKSLWPSRWWGSKDLITKQRWK